MFLYTTKYSTESQSQTATRPKLTAKGDIALLSYSPGGSMHHLVFPCILTPYFRGRGGPRGQWWHRSKEWWCFPTGSPLWPLHYL